jgi:transmembrane sensor
VSYSYYKVIRDFMVENEEQVFWELAGKNVAGEINKEEQAKLNSMLEKNPQLLRSLEAIGHYWNAQKNNAEDKDREFALDRHMLRLIVLNPGTTNNESKDKPVIDLYKGNIKRFRRIAVVAAIATFALLLIFLYRNTESATRKAMRLPSIETIVVLKGSRNHFVLPDGSTVWLNAGTKINYLSSFKTDSIREVFLIGEAYFEIKHDDKHPFWIHTSQVDIRDIGTSFNVKAYPSDTITETTLVEGSIQVKMKNSETFTTLNHRHEKITVHNSIINDNTVIERGLKKSPKENPLVQSIKVTTAITSMQEDSLLVETAWLKGMLVFRNESFEELAVRMERWYNITISFEKPECKRYRFSGTFNNETIEDALKELQTIKPFSFKFIRENIVIWN